MSLAPRDQKRGVRERFFIFYASCIWMLHGKAYMCALLNTLRAWASAGGVKRVFAPFPLGNWALQQKCPRKVEVNRSIPIKWFNSCSDSLFAGKTLHKSQVRGPGVCSGELAVHLCLLHCVDKLGSGFFCCWSLLRNSNIVHFKLRS